MLYPAQSLSPGEIAMLSRVSRTICEELSLPLASERAQKTAAHILKLFMNGLTDEAELLDAERNRTARLERV